MKLKPEEVEHVAHLSRLALTAEEREMYTTQLNQILEHFEKLQELNTDNIPPTSHILPMKNVLREDEIRESLAKDEALKNAPDTDSNYFLVPKVIE